MLKRAAVRLWRCFRPAPAASEPSFGARLAAAVESADASLVDRGLLRLEGQLASGTRLLGDDHPQLQPGVIGSDHTFLAKDFEEVASLVAASCIGHSADAWAYFASATRAALAGDLSIARHLIYYSELRSAFAILARHGILIRSSHHLVLSSSKLVTYVGPQPTHNAVWDALKAWMKTAEAKSFFLDGLHIDRASLRDWLEAQGEVEFAQKSMDDILRIVGYDLSHFTLDRARRNTASYGTRHLQDFSSRHIDGWMTNKLQEYWSTVEPVLSNGFEALDTHFCLRVLIRGRELDRKGTSPDKLYAHFEETAKRLNLDQPETIAETAKRYKETPAGRVVFDATRTDRPEEDTVVLTSMLSRAMLLARFATLSVESLVKDSGISRSSFDSWTANLGAQHGLWDSEVTLADVWEDSMASAQELAAFEGSASLRALMTSGGEFAFSATSFAALALWWRQEWLDELPTVA